MFCLLLERWDVSMPLECAGRKVRAYPCPRPSNRTLAFMMQSGATQILQGTFHGKTYSRTTTLAVPLIEDSYRYGINSVA